MPSRYLLSLVLSVALTGFVGPALAHFLAITSAGQDKHPGTVTRRRDNRLIEPGVRVGPLRLGDPRARALDLFPAGQHPGEPYGCGEGILSSVSSDSGEPGNLLVLVRDGKVIQIDSATTRFHTAEGITAYDSPDKVRQHYVSDLRAYVFDITSMALGDRPVVFWVDAKHGIAFEFAYDRGEHRRYLYAITVFHANRSWCPEGETPDTTHWREIAPYSLGEGEGSEKKQLSQSR